MAQQAAKRAEATKPAYSGRLLLRMPPELHAELARHAEREQQSLNQFITGAVSGAVGWEEGVKRSERSRLTSPRALTAALVVNLIVLAVAGTAAIALLVLVWRGSA
jgi:HicB family